MHAFAVGKAVTRAGERFRALRTLEWARSGVLVLMKLQILIPFERLVADRAPVRSIIAMAKLVRLQHAARGINLATVITGKLLPSVKLLVFG